MKSKHSPGPWRVINGFNENGKGTYFPSVLLGKDQSKNGFMRPKIVINESHDSQGKTMMANARLIASAPEMYDLLCRLRDDFVMFKMPISEVQQVIDKIEKPQPIVEK